MAHALWLREPTYRLTFCGPKLLHPDDQCAGSKFPYPHPDDFGRAPKIFPSLIPPPHSNKMIVYQYNCCVCKFSASSISQHPLHVKWILQDVHPGPTNSKCMVNAPCAWLSIQGNRQRGRGAVNVNKNRNVSDTLAHIPQPLLTNTGTPSPYHWRRRMLVSVRRTSI